MSIKYDSNYTVETEGQSRNIFNVGISVTEKLLQAVPI